MSFTSAALRGAGPSLTSYKAQSYNAGSTHHRVFTRQQLAPRSGSDNAELNTSAEEMVQQLLSNDPEAQDRVARVTDAAAKVAELQIEQARLARALADAQSDTEASEAMRQQRAQEASTNIMAEAEVKAAALLLRAAELEAESADSLRASVAAQADLEAERVETGKAGAAAAAGGAAAVLPLLVVASESQLSSLVTLGGAAASTFLFGLVYRYAVRTDLGNTQLKAGVVAAFGLVRGLAGATEVINAGSAGLTELPSPEVLGSAAAVMGESMLLFAFASVALEFAFQREWVKLFKGR